MPLQALARGLKDATPTLAPTLTALNLGTNGIQVGWGDACGWVWHETAPGTRCVGGGIIP